ncbi:TolB family protein, partial [Xanthovirga aplysinae]|uniref:TolB family protein n=1 Tax=Xanthovirga aplysinae TaxID=2529853 RepID=UPI003CCD020E|nr:hypothetical protein [Xanthovirga aplysinae]
MKTKNLKEVKTLIFVTLLLGLITSCQESKKPESPTYNIAYGSTETGNVEIYSGDTEGKSDIKSTNAKGGYLAWSPDGKQFAFYGKYDDKKTWSIHTMNIDGTNRKRLTHAKNKWD